VVQGVITQTGFFRDGFYRGIFWGPLCFGRGLLGGSQGNCRSFPRRGLIPGRFLGVGNIYSHSNFFTSGWPLDCAGLWGTLFSNFRENIFRSGFPWCPPSLFVWGPFNPLLGSRSMWSPGVNLRGRFFGAPHIFLWGEILVSTPEIFGGTIFLAFAPPGVYSLLIYEGHNTVFSRRQFSPRTRGRTFFFSK